MWYWMAEPFLYVCFAIVSGYVLLSLVPDAYRPVTRLSHKAAAIAALGIGLFSFFPILRIVSFFAEDIGWGLTFRKVLLDFTEGRAYIFTLILSLILAGMIILAGRAKGAGGLKGILFILSLLMVAQGWSSHVASWYGTWGILAQTLHLMAVSLWAGPLLMAGWQNRRTEHWRGFLGWFHPVAILCMTVIAASGFVLTIGVAPEYVNAWKLTYGQALLLKHLFILPLALFAVVNGFWVKRKLLKDADFNPQPWAKVEGAILLLIFAVTGFMNQQPAPHDVSNTLNESPASPLYLWFTGGNLDKENDLILLFGWLSASLLLAALVSMVTAIVCAKRQQAAQALLWALACSLLLYYGLMSAV
jgi:putative copper resistance protein D